MNQTEFKSTMKRAKLFQEIHAGDMQADFYVGVQRGLRRLYHGEDFGYESEHQKWMSLSPWMKSDGKKTDWDSMAERIVFDSRRLRGMGYRIGLNYDNLPNWDESPAADDIRVLRKILGWSVWEMAAYCGVSHRTVEGWEQGRNVSGRPAEILKKLIEV